MICVKKAQGDAVNKIKASRMACRMTQKQVADRLHIHRTAYLRIENGTRIPSVTVALEIAHLFGTSVEVLFGE